MAVKGITVEPVTDVMAEDFSVYNYGYLTYMSEVLLTDMNGSDRKEYGSTVNWQELIEARFFGGKQELHIWREGDAFVGRRLTETGNADAVEMEVPLMRKFFPAGGKMVIKKYIDYDEDGQAYVANTCIRDICQEVG